MTDTLSPNRMDLQCIGTPRYLSNVGKSMSPSTHVRLETNADPVNCSAFLAEPIDWCRIKEVDDASSGHVMEQVGIYVERNSDRFPIGLGIACCGIGSLSFP